MPFERCHLKPAFSSRIRKLRICINALLTLGLSLRWRRSWRILSTVRTFDEDFVCQKLQLICSRFTEGHVEEFIAKQKYKAKFTELKPAAENPIRPKPRSQAAYAFDEIRQLIYMFGGNDDTTELNDFWVFDVAKSEWSTIESLNGPSSRSGCKMVFDPFGNQIFIIGRKSLRGSENLKVSRVISNDPIDFIELFLQSDFYLFDVSRKSWILICEDTSLENGPSVVSDHQMTISQELRTIYIFGGKLTNR